jgi:hypothetical protein
MKRLVLIILSALFLTACSNVEDAVPETPSVPLFCDQTKVLEAFPERVANAKYIPTDWEPAEGTDLYAAYNAGGIACTYGIGEAEVGATILWAPDFEITFSEREKFWIEAGQKEVDLPGLDEEKAYYLSQGTEGQGEFIIWQLNVLANGYWVQVGATFLNSIEEAMPIVKAAFDSILTTEEAEAENIKGCYFAEANSDLLIMDLTYHENTTVTGNLAYQLFQKDASKGSFVGTYENGILRGIYTFTSEGMDSERELFFKRTGKGFVPGYGPVEIIENRLERLQRPLQIEWDNEYKYNPGEECATVIKGIN